MDTSQIIQLVKDLFPDPPRRVGGKPVNIGQAIVFYELFQDWNIVGRILGLQAEGVQRAVRRHDRRMQ
jgi:hypothetical protein